MLSYLVFILTIGGTYALLALSLNLAWGTTGLVNLGLAGFFAIGAYGSALATTGGAPFVVGLLTAVVVSVLAGLLVTFATLRLRDDYLAIVTLGFAEVVRLVALNERWLTKGADGISGIPAPLRGTLTGFQFEIFYLALVTSVLIGVWLILHRIDKSAYGRTLKSIREDQELSGFAGKRVLRFKFEAFALSAGIAGFAGALYGHQQSYISPDHFQPLITIYIFLAVTAGGVGRPLGAVLGAYLLIAFLESTRFLAGVAPGLTAVQLAAVREMLVGIALLVVLRWKPNGLLPETIPSAPRPAS
jgi:branched-chain amino acid transport system permease protein